MQPKAPYLIHYTACALAIVCSLALVLGPRGAPRLDERVVREVSSLERRVSDAAGKRDLGDAEIAALRADVADVRKRIEGVKQAGEEGKQAELLLVIGILIATFGMLASTLMIVRLRRSSDTKNQAPF